MNILKFLFGMDDTGPEARDYIAKNCKEGVDPTSNISDYGEFDDDYSQDQHDRADGKAANRDEDGIGYPTKEETDLYYENSRSVPIGIRKEDK